MSPFFRRLSDPSPTTPVVKSGPISGADAALDISERIRSAGLATPAVLLLRALRPAHWLGAQMLYIAQPFLESLGMGSPPKHGPGAALSPSTLARFLENEKNVDNLLHTLEKGLLPTQQKPPSTEGKSHENR